MLIAITGKKRRGKDTVANYLVQKYGFNKHGFADKVKELAYAANPLILVTYGEVDKTNITQNWINEVEETYHVSGIGWMFRLRDLVDYMGWEEAKEISDVRKFLQKVGTEGGRTVFRLTFWIDEFFTDMEKRYDTYETSMNIGGGVYQPVTAIQSNIAIPDGRFDNEMLRVKDRGGFVWEVVSDRKGLPEPDEHASENGVSRHLIDHTFHNNGTVEELYAMVEAALQTIKAR